MLYCSPTLLNAKAVAFPQLLRLKGHIALARVVSEKVLEHVYLESLVSGQLAASLQHTALVFEGHEDGSEPAAPGMQ